MEGGVELLQVKAALHRGVAEYAGRPLEWAVKLKVPTDGGLPGLYNGRCYDGLYLLKGGGKPVWKLFPRIKKDWRKPHGIIFGKRCGTTQNIGPAARGSQVAIRSLARTSCGEHGPVAYGACGMRRKYLRKTPANYRQDKRVAEREQSSKGASGFCRFHRIGNGAGRRAGFFDIIKCVFRVKEVFNGF